MENTVPQPFATWNGSRDSRSDRSALQHCLPAIPGLQPPILRLRAKVAQGPAGTLQSEGCKCTPGFVILREGAGQQFTRGARRGGAVPAECLHPPQAVSARAELRHLVARVN